MAMRITRANVEALKDALDVLADLVDMRDDMETWLDNQDELKTEGVRDMIRDARDSFESQLDDLYGACRDVLDIMSAPAFPKRKKSA